MTLRHLALAPLATLALVFVTSAQASPLISIGEGGTTSWADAISNGNVNAVADPLSGFAAQEFYNLAIGQDMGNGPINFVVAAPNIQITPQNPVFDGDGEGHDSLVMTWDDSEPDTLGVAAWDYVYDVDPDLRGTRIDFSILPPPGIWDFSLELFDINGNSAGWFGTPPTANWGNFVINPSLASAQGPFLSYIEQPGFDLSQVIVIRLNESSQGGLRFDPRPLGPPIPPTGPWNAWNHLRVRLPVPEPATVLIFALGLAGLAFSRRSSVY
ncbi:MAG: PEP-CTERM sorting domain-containing protein [Alphaproteobacteria bacterium]|nr:PEP-CTERM sorting domain-containing protein [Alphaproteobacteria bacterium]